MAPSRPRHGPTTQQASRFMRTTSTRTSRPPGVGNSGPLRTTPPHTPTTPPRRVQLGSAPHHNSTHTHHPARRGELRSAPPPNCPCTPPPLATRALMSTVRGAWGGRVRCAPQLHTHTAAPPGVESLGAHRNTTPHARRDPPGRVQLGSAPSPDSTRTPPTPPGAGNSAPLRAPPAQPHTAAPGDQVVDDDGPAGVGRSGAPRTTTPHAHRPCPAWGTQVRSAPQLHTHTPRPARRGEVGCAPRRNSTRTPRPDRGWGLGCAPRRTPQARRPVSRVAGTRRRNVVPARQNGPRD
jgi:hypothetical protein